MAKKSKRELRFAALTIGWNDGMLEYWNVGFGRLGERGIGVLTNKSMKCYYSIIPLFHHSWLEEKGWLVGNPLLSKLFRNFDISSYGDRYGQI
ncbi:MAG: hypothetical protein PVH61_17080 [Candidatus Aminicenantes bacterium]|jgi:hypothetical protein